jgi:hypothetical protein
MNYTQTVMPEIESVQEENFKEENVNENISREQIIETTQPETQNPQLETENMEVHHHPKVEKKNFKEYFLEFVMIFLAVTLGFFAESLREHLVNSEKERGYMESMIQDLKKDTAEATETIALQSLLLKKMDSALKIPVESLRDINTQDTFYHYFVYFYSWIYGFGPHDNTITQLKNTAGFNVIQKKMVVDSINELYTFWDAAKGNADFYANRWQRLDEFAMQMIILPQAPDNPEDTVYTTYPHHAEMFTRYDRPLLQQLYSFIRFEHGDIEVNMYDEAQYRDRAARLIKFIRKEYDLNDE